MISPSPPLVQRSWLEALKALRANLLPGILLQLLMASMGAAYLWNPAARHFFEELACLRSNWGLLFSFLGTSFASAIMPEALSFLLLRRKQTGTSGMGLGTRLLFGIPFWGAIGMQVDLFYRLQYLIFGPSDSIFIIMKKVLVDAFIYCPVLAVPQAVCILLWKDHGFTLHGFANHTPARFYALKIFPVLMANWMVWIPLICIIYALPSALGVPFFIVAQSFWVLVLTTLSSPSPQNS
ncbi:MAG: hypothetical protein WCP60_07215 [bacterium]